MESHYKDSLSTAIVNILLQCGFENSSKRALDELIGMSLNYMKNITSKISNLTNDCNLPESDILIGLGALKLHGHNLDELFDFCQNYNDIFPPAPKTYFGPIPLKASSHAKRNEEKPLEFVSWVPELSPSLATIGMKLKNRQIVSDPNFDRSNYSALSLDSSPPPCKNDLVPKSSMSGVTCTSVIKSQKYGSNCTYQLPPEAYPNKYEPPTIDLDCNGAVIGLNGKTGKLPDPFISDIEEQDLLRHKSKFLELQHQKASYPHHHSQMLLFNGVQNHKKQSRATTPALLSLESSSHDEMKENISSSKNNQNNGVLMHSSPNSYGVHCNESLMSTTTNYKPCNQISDDVWNAALQAKVEPLMTKPESLVTSATAITDSPVNRSTSTAVRKAKKHTRTFSSSRPKKIRKLDVSDELQDPDKTLAISNPIYMNESTMDSFVSERSVPYSSQFDDRELMYNHYDTYHSSNNVRDKSPSYSPINNFVPTEDNNIYYQTEMIPDPPVPSTVTAAKSFKSKRKSTRKTHFTNKRKKKSIYSPTTVVNSNNIATSINQNPLLYSTNHQPPIHNYHRHHQMVRMDHCLDGTSIVSQRSLSTPSLHLPMETYFDDSDDDRTEPMQESSEELMKLLEVTDPNNGGKQNSTMVSVMESPPLLNNNHVTSSIPSNQQGSGSIRMKIKIRKNKNSVTRGPSSIVNSNTDLSSPIQSQHSDDRNSISERLQLMNYHSPLSENECGPRHHHGSYEKSPNSAHYDEIQQRSPAYSSTQESFRDFYRPDNSVASGAMSPMFSKPPTPTTKLTIRPQLNFTRLNSSSTHSSPKTLPALDECDKIPTLLFKTSISVKKRKRSRIGSGSKKIKSKKSVKLKINHEEPIQKSIEKHFVSVDDVFSDEDDSNKIEQNHLNSVNVNTQPLVSQRPMQQLPVIVDKSLYRTPIPPIKISSKSSIKKSSKSKSKLFVMNSPPVKPMELKHVYNYCCLQGEAFYKSEDGKTVYTCPICNTEDNGSLMLGCDRCEDWYHGLCLGIFIPPPEDQDWFCPRCHEDKLSESLTIGSSKSKSKSRTKKK